MEFGDQSLILVTNCRDVVETETSCQSKSLNHDFLGRLQDPKCHSQDFCVGRRRAKPQQTTSGLCTTLAGSLEGEAPVRVRRGRRFGDRRWPFRGLERSDDLMGVSKRNCQPKQRPTGFQAHEVPQIDLGNIKRRHRRHLKLTSKLKLRYMVILTSHTDTRKTHTHTLHRLHSPGRDFGGAGGRGHWI